ncbi:HRDC domain-containing protein [Ochromonadaceae sp. CCMP2298]|nr:HRDC domain-containing protein [Ochromonadaceae sp. CCMP2298]|mmetsp:Transcript_26085/g.57763  ORF Transcript_26085/g.57763 Transcript_26085/m.57763 type:complete len:142 (+) Transcript_26085:83-508(+)
MSLRDELQSFRTREAQRRGLKAYCIFPNATLELLVERKPRSLNELLSIKGIGSTTCNNYGSELIRIITGADVATPLRTLPATGSNAGSHWTPEEKYIVLQGLSEGKSVKVLAIETGRSSCAIQMFIERYPVVKAEPRQLKF